MSEAPPFYNATLGCVHCGLCLSACPTYDALGLETDSPRGRITLMRAMAEGRLANPAAIRPHLDQCLDCRACETACPSGVRYGEILAGARHALAAQFPAKGFRARLRRFLLVRVVADQGRLRLVFAMARVAEVLGLRWLAQRIGLVPPLAGELVPRVPPGPRRRPITGVHEPTTGEVRGTVALFTGCIMEPVFGDLNRKTLAVLLANGFRVRAIAEQVCCGALLLHDGQLERARKLAEQNVEAFAGVDAVIHNAAGCGAAMREYGHLLKTPAAEDLVRRCQDICEFLAERGLTNTPKPFPKRVAYDDPCHLCHGQGVRNAPRELLAQVPALELVSHASSEVCCGSAGIYNLNQPQLAAEIGAAKASELIRTGAAVVATGNPGCIMQIRAHLRRAGSTMEVVHPVELLGAARE